MDELVAKIFDERYTAVAIACIVSWFLWQALKMTTNVLKDVQEKRVNEVKEYASSVLKGSEHHAALRERQHENELSVRRQLSASDAQAGDMAKLLERALERIERSDQLHERHHKWLQDFEARRTGSDG